jgi:cysteine synthase B
MNDLKKFTLFSTIGNTPLVCLKKLNPNPNVELYAKLESMNPAGSVKDRTAYYMIKNSMQIFKSNHHNKLIEVTAGNTGIALAMIANVIGINIELVMPENLSKERIKVMRAYGAKVILTPAEKGMLGAIDYAKEKIKKEKYYMIDQFSNFNNTLAHYETTGPEIWRDTTGNITHFVSAMGTTGTIMGVSKFLKEKNPAINIVGCQPEEGSCIIGIRRWPPEYMPAIYEPHRVDKIVDVSEEQAIEMMRRLALEEGIFAGVSSGGAAHVAINLCKNLDKGKVVFIVCDSGDRYLSLNYFSS